MIKEICNTWQEQAEALFFIEHLGINEIAKIVKRHRNSVSAHLNNCPDYEKETEYRKIKSKEARREYQRNWVRQSRSERYQQITGDSLKQEHEMAVRILSSEKY